MSTTYLEMGHPPRLPHRGGPGSPRAGRRPGPLPGSGPMRMPGATPAPASTAPGIMALPALAAAILKTLPMGSSGIVIPTAARMLTLAEQAEAKKVYGGSLDFSRIAITNGLGIDGRKFTVAVPLAGTWFVVINMGGLGSWAAPKKSVSLVHELAHAWQSQHHGSSPAAFMANSVLCQVAATTAAYVSGKPVSAYAYIPGKPFSAYAAEQVPQQVEDTYSGAGSPTPGILKTIQGVAANRPSKDNEASLTVISFYARGAPGVVYR